MMSSPLPTIHQDLPTAPKTLPYIQQIDGLRAIAVLLVLWSHTPYIAGNEISKLAWDITGKLSIGYFGVDIFFVMSGFLITRILLNSIDNHGSISLRSFYIKRAFRIFPAYYICVAMYAVFFAFDGQGLASLILYSFNYFHALNPAPHPMEHTWSLSVEEQFYLVWPLLIMLIPRAYGRLVTGLVIPLIAAAIAVSLAMMIKGTTASELIYMSSVTRMMSLSLGASLAYREVTGTNISEKRAFHLAALGLAVLIVDFGLRFAKIMPPDGYFQAVAVIGFAVSSFGIIALFINPQTPGLVRVQGALTVEPLRYIGRISYGLYLYHYLLLHALGLRPDVTANTGTSAGLVAAFLLLSFGVAAASYALIEAPLIRLGRRLDGPVRGKSAMQG